jgi:hypothetical protein
MEEAEYQSLTQKGLQMSQEDFRKIIDTISQGAKEAMEYLGVQDDMWPAFTISDSIPVLGYSGKDDVIGFSMRHLNHITSSQTQLMYKDQLVCYIPDTFYIIIKYLSWLKMLGRESTIHRYQKLGNPMLKAQFPEVFAPELSVKLLLMSDIEVEARTACDEIAGKLGDLQLWQNVNAYFLEQFPQYYNKKIEELILLPKPTLPISFEMESFGL